MLIYSTVRGRAKQLLEVLEVADLEKPGGLAMVWTILDRAHERMDHERADDAYTAWEAARRKPGQTIEEWLTYLRKVKLELEAQDPALTISDKQYASKMLRGAVLPQDRKAQALFNCGGIYDPLRMETVLRVGFPRIADAERKQGLVVPRSRTNGRDDSSRTVFRKKDDKTRDYKHDKRSKKVHVCEGMHDETDDEESDEEEDPNDVYLQQDPEHSGDEQEPEGDDSGEEPEEQGPTELMESFVAAWSAKKKTNQKRL